MAADTLRPDNLTEPIASQARHGLQLTNLLPRQVGHKFGLTTSNTANAAMLQIVGLPRTTSQPSLTAKPTAQTRTAETKDRSASKSPMYFANAKHIAFTSKPLSKPANSSRLSLASGGEDPNAEWKLIEPAHNNANFSQTLILYSRLNHS
jgi:hypothetical protein